MALTLGDVLQKKPRAAPADAAPVGRVSLLERGRSARAGGAQIAPSPRRTAYPPAPAVRAVTNGSSAAASPLPGGQPAHPRATAAADARWTGLIARAGLIATGAFLFSIAQQLWAQGQVTEHHEVVFLVFACYGMAFLLLAGGVLPRGFARRLVMLIPAATIAAFLMWSYVRIDISLALYGTDNAVFSHVAAEQLLDGKNPYTVNDPALIDASVERFGLPSTFVTRTTDGQPLAQLMSWPAGSVLPLVPALALGLDDVRWVVVAFQVATLVLLWRRAPRELRPLTLLPLIVDPDLFLQFTGGGVMDWLWVLPMAGAAISLYGGRFGRTAFLYGLAAGTKQQPWLLAPFLAIYVWNGLADRPAAERRDAMLEFVGLGAAGFLLLNLPFVVWDFGAWTDGVLLPFRAQLVPFGSGISLLTQAGISDQPRSFYSLATFGVWGVALLAYAIHFRTLRHTLWLAPAVVMWFGYRGLQNYFIYWTPMLLIALMVWWEEQRSQETDLEVVT